jgi:hypothetical protein
MYHKGAVFRPRESLCAPGGLLSRLFIESSLVRVAGIAECGNRLVYAYSPIYRAPLDA